MATAVRGSPLSDVFALVPAISLRLDGTLGFPSEEYQTCGKGPTSHVLYRIKRDICGQTYPTSPVFWLKFRDLDMPSDLHPNDSTSSTAASVSPSRTFHVSNSSTLPSHPRGAGGLRRSARTLTSWEQHRGGTWVPRRWSLLRWPVLTGPCFGTG